MVRGIVRISAEELTQVLGHYDIGVIHQTRRLSGGSRHAAKLVIISDRGQYLLKRRPKSKEDLYHVAFSHAIQNHLAGKSFPVATILTTTDEHNTILCSNDHIYELFEFVRGVRYDGSAEATADAGRQLANLHQNMADFDFESAPMKGSFHDSSTIRQHLKTACTAGSDKANKELRDTAVMLMDLYNGASVRVNTLGFDSWSQQVIHGDWHQGNMLFAGRKLVAVLDFDSAKIAPPVTDLANGMLQFSIVGSRPNPVDWPGYLDQAKLVLFINGYREVIKLDEKRLLALPDLMMETMIAEAILPIAATGFFGHLSGAAFLKMIHRKTAWIEENKKALLKAITG